MVQRIARSLLAASAVLLLSSAVGGPRASEVVTFVNGSSMPVLSHKIEKGTITLELSPGATIAFPAANVERIESNGRSVWTPAATGEAANRVVSGIERGGGGGLTAMAGSDFSTSAAARRRDRFLSNPSAEFVNPGEMARDGELGRPVQGPPGRNLRRMAGPGAPRSDDPSDLRRMGDRLVIDPVRGPSNHAGQPIIGLGAKGSVPPPVEGDRAAPPADDNPALPDGESSEVPDDGSSGDQ